MVSYVCYQQNLNPADVGPEHICTTDVERIIYDLWGNCASKITNARKVCRKLGNMTLFPSKHYEQIHPLLAEWLLKIPESRNKPSKSHCMYFLTWCSENVWIGTSCNDIPMGLLTRDVLWSYKRFLIQRVRTNQIKGRTGASYLACVVQWIAWLRVNKIIGPIDTSTLTIEAKGSSKREVPTHLQISKFLQVTAEYEDTRDLLTYFLFLVWTGCRPIDLYNMRIFNIGFKDQTVWFQSKGGPKRIFPVPNSLWKLFLEPISSNIDLQPNDYVFRRVDGRKITYSHAMRVFNAIRRRAEIQIDGQMAFRHRFATDCLEQGIDPKITMSLVGHTDLATMAVYQHVQQYKSQQMVNEAINKIPWRKEL